MSGPCNSRHVDFAPVPEQFKLARGQHIAAVVAGHRCSWYIKHDLLLELSWMFWYAACICAIVTCRFLLQLRDTVGTTKK